MKIEPLAVENSAASFIEQVQSEKFSVPSGSLNFQVNSSFPPSSKFAAKVSLPFLSSNLPAIKFGFISYSMPIEFNYEIVTFENLSLSLSKKNAMLNLSTVQLVSLFKNISDDVKIQDESLCVELPTSNMPLDSIRVSILDVNPIVNVSDSSSSSKLSVPLSIPNQCPQVLIASRTRKGKAKLESIPSVIPMVPLSNVS